MTAPTGASRQMSVGPVATAGNDLSTELLVVPSDGTVTSVTYIPVSTITGAATNNRTVSLVNKGQSGGGSTVVATLTFDVGINATGSDEKAITLSATPANLNVSAGDVLLWQSTHVGTGIADPGGLVNLTISAKYA